jgi:hypothetical protein
VQKEITVICELKKENLLLEVKKEQHTDTENEYTAAQSGVDWLLKLKAEVRQKNNRELGIFGTSIGGTWLFSEFETEVSYFVDEDESRVGKKYMDKSVLHPSEVKKGGYIVIPMPYEIATQIASRLKDTNGVYYAPSPLCAQYQPTIGPSSAYPPDKA